MAESAGTPRRQFLVLSAVAALELAFRRNAWAGPSNAPPPGAPSEAAWLTLEAAFSRILPSDQGPGAREAQVGRFVRMQLRQPDLARAGPLLSLTAKLLDNWSLQGFQKDFAALPVEGQDSVLGALADGQIPAPRFPQKEAFRLLHVLTLEGFLSDPIHGGNADEVGWRAVGFVTPHRRKPGEPSHSH